MSTTHTAFLVSMVAMAAGLALGGCSSDPYAATWGSNNSMGGVRYDADGNRVDASGVGSNTNANRPVDVASGMTSSDRGNAYAANWVANGNRADQYGGRAGSGGYGIGVNEDRMGSSGDAQYRSDDWGTNLQGHPDSESGGNTPTMIAEAELPAVVRSTFQRLSQGNALTDTGRTSWNGKTGYCASTTINGATYKMAADSEGTLLWMKRLDTAEKGVGPGG